MTDAHAEHEEHSVAHYTKIAVILIALAFVSYLGPMLEIKTLTLVTAFGIAVVKAYLVIKHFMHLTVERKVVGYFLLTAVAFMFLLFAGTAADVMNHEGRNWVNVAAKSEVQRALSAPKESHGHGASDDHDHADGAHSHH